MDLSPIILIIGVSAFVVIIVHMIERCHHEWEIIQEGKDPDGKKYQILRCRKCNQFIKNRI